MQVFMRNMTPGDIPEVQKLYTAGWQNAFKGIVPQDYLEQMNLDNWAPPLDGAYVLTDGEKVLGTSSIAGARDKAFAGWGEIISVYVLPNLIGQGYGHILFTFAVEKLLSLGFHKIYLTVFEDNLRARAFYEKHGFAQDGQKLSMEVGGRELTELRYVYVK